MVASYRIYSTIFRRFSFAFHAKQKGIDLVVILIRCSNKLMQPLQQTELVNINNSSANQSGC